MHLRRHSPLLCWPSPSYWYIFRQFSVHTVKGLRRYVPLPSWIEKKTASTRYTVNRSRTRTLPPREEGRERYLRHADSAWTNRKYDVTLFPSTNPSSFPSYLAGATPFLRVFSFLFFPRSLLSSRFVHLASIFMTQETNRLNARWRLICKIHLNLNSQTWTSCNGLGSWMTAAATRFCQSQCIAKSCVLYLFKICMYISHNQYRIIFLIISDIINDNF